MNCVYCNSVLCKACDYCHKCYLLYAQQANCVMLAATTAQPRTQKGIGIKVLREALGKGAVATVLPVLAYAQEAKHLNGLNWPLFARPCPSSPKHGYIDSRVVKSEEEAVALLEEVLADDPLGELMLCGFVNASFNMIWTPGSLVIGPGHDGATAGKHALTVPLAGTVPGWLQNCYTAAKIGGSNEEWPYIEAVWAKGTNSSTLTQLRAGPKIISGGDYIPKQVTVLKVLKADPALYKDRDWEKLIDSEGTKPGTVVWHPGGAMTDHFSIHAFTHQIPVIFGKEPAIDSVLEPVEGQEALKFDPHEMLLGALAGEKIELVPSTYGVTAPSHAVEAMLLALHNATAMTGTNSRWVGFAAAIMLRLGVTALRGEARHSNIAGLASKPSRETIYQLSFKLKLGRHRASVNRLVNLFRYGQWNGGSFGGIKWAMCGAATVGLFQAFKELAANPSEETAAALVRALNVAVNQAHNGGWWLNKFASVQAFTTIQQGEPGAVLGCTPTLYKAGLIMKGLQAAPKTVAEAITKWAAWPDTNLAPPRARDVQMTYQPGIAAIGLRYKTRLLGPAQQVILAPVKQILDVKDVITGHTFFAETEDGYEVVVRAPGAKPVVLWHDELLKDKAAEVAQTGVTK